MKENKNIFDYFIQVFVIFGFTILTLNIFCLICGDSAKGVSAIFELGSKGIPVKIAFQFLCVSALIVGAKFIFFTDTVIKNMSICLRTVCMLISIIVIQFVFILMFDWFPVYMWQPWVMFFVCFGISFIGSYLVVTIKEKLENKQMEDALQRLQKKSEK